MSKKDTTHLRPGAPPTECRLTIASREERASRQIVRRVRRVTERAAAISDLRESSRAAVTARVAERPDLVVDGLSS